MLALVKYLFCLYLSFIVFAGSSSFAQNSPPNLGEISEDFVTAKIQSVSATNIDESLFSKTGIKSRHQNVVLEISEGPLSGLTATVANEITDNPAYNILPKPGEEVIVAVTKDKSGKVEINIADYKRQDKLLILLFVFLAAFLFFGGKQGLKSLVGLGICIGLISFVLLPLSLQGFNPIITAVVICALTTAALMLIVAGFSKKAAASILGTVGGVVIAGIASWLMIDSAPLTGLSSEEAQILRGSTLMQPPEFYRGLLASGMLIGALGVIMDVGISIASAVTELKNSNPSLDAGELYKLGMNVGRDIMGTMTCTLVLAYAGGALPLLLLVSQMPSVKLLNLDLVATEIAAALTGSLGLVCTIPLTAFIAAKLMADTKSSKTESSNLVDPANFLSAKEADLSK
jgi:uncharacterized membrane protein